MLKILGIFFIKDIILSIPSLLSVFYSFGDRDTAGAISTLLVTLFTLLVYCIVAYFFIFQTQQVLERLHLLENLPEDPLPLNIHRSTVVNIAVLVVALLLITEAIPRLLRELIKWYQYNAMSRGLYSAMQPFDYTMVLAYAAEIIIALLLIGYNRQLVSYIELKTRKTTG